MDFAEHCYALGYRAYKVHGWHDRAYKVHGWHDGDAREEARNVLHVALGTVFVRCSMRAGLVASGSLARS